MSCIKTWQETSHTRIVEAILGMCHLQPINMLHPEYLPVKNTFIIVGILEHPHQVGGQLVDLLLCFHVSFLMNFYILHAFFNNLSKTFKVNIEVSLQGCSNFLNDLPDEFCLDLVDLGLGVGFEDFFHL